ncbi:2-hydroxy-6-oxo-6-phenylhexa-2,4-dienoate hydrolase [Bhargavaea cecembensis DSE10]|uniref:2-hydroxy-6-oxo-6-phenylhexa-2,4-dienoate hydrolase n=1 Tax=Bhargavaea cecembensis DSE10 TaxID=1235279 RepID=M7NEJ8_9BACL|nr:alpha/beta hydrolase [Bhargavaea cecembensis]EMR06983.1 2-hydroxy-6-oxo-6-phenylhexa-2,4-dienoate hydrolase [Bhargavaea cecembensis DSE10]
MAIKQRKVKTGDYETYIHEGGVGNSETVILLHGSGPGASASANWKAILPEYEDRFHVVAPDLVGFGDTDHPTEYPENGAQWMNLRLKQVLDLMDTLNIDKAHLVGNSLGGVISLFLAMEAPDRFDRIVLMGAGGGLTEPTPELAKLANFHKDPSKKSMYNLLSWFLYDLEGMEDKLQAIVDERFEIFSREEVRRSYRENFTNSHLSDMLVPPSALKRMKQEFLLIHGHQDRFVPLQSSLYVMDYLENAELHVFKRCGHWAQVEQKDRFLGLTKEFFSRGKVAEPV